MRRHAFTGKIAGGQWAARSLWRFNKGRNVRSQRLTAVLLPLAALAALSLSPASAIAQSQRTRSDEDINTIGHRSVGKCPNLYSLEREKKLGEQLAQDVERSSKLLDDVVVSEYINRLAQKIAQNSDARLPITVRVLDSDVINALVLPGGFQYVNKGLILQTEGEAELAAVLAHGIAHTAIRSATKNATKGELMQLATIPLILLGPGGWAGYDLFEGLNLAIPVNYLKFRRDAEREADFFGLQYLYKAGYDPESFSRFIERVWPKVSAGKNIPKAFSPFPPMPERVRAIKKEIETMLPHQESAIVSSSEFEEIRERLRACALQKATGTDENRGKPTLRKPTDEPSKISQTGHQ